MYAMQATVDTLTAHTVAIARPGRVMRRLWCTGRWAAAVAVRGVSWPGEVLWSIEVCCCCCQQDWII